MIPAKPIDKQDANENGNGNGIISASNNKEKQGDEKGFGSKRSSSRTTTSTYCYTDYAPPIELFPSNLADKNPPSHSSSFGLSSSLSTSRIAGPRSTFTDVRSQILPAKLNAMLTDPSFSHIISWLPHGRAWIVLHPGEFKKQVAPIYFEQPNYSSFIRLVNAWGFRRFSSGLDERAYYHELFLRGMPHLHLKMKRLTRSQKKVQIDPRDEPDFYKMEPLPYPGVPSYLPPSTTSVAHNYTTSKQNNFDYPTSHSARGHEQAGYIDMIAPVHSYRSLLRIPVEPTMKLPDGLVRDPGGLIVHSPSATAASVELRMPSSIRSPQPYYEPSNLNQYQEAMSASRARRESKDLRNSLQASMASFLPAQNQNADHLFAVQQRVANQINPSADSGVAIKRVSHLLASSLQHNRDMESTYLSQVRAAPDSNPSLMQGRQVFPTNLHEQTYILALHQQRMEEEQQLIQQQQQLIQEQQQISHIARYQGQLEYKIALQQHDLEPHYRSRSSLNDVQY